jgi:hypothetical protein
MTDQGAPDWFKAYTAAGGQPPAAPAAPRAAGGRPVEPHLDLVRSTAAKHGLNPALLAGIWDFESSGNAGAINRASGATGLGQVMPREAGSSFRDRPTQQELLDPATNAEWSARILKSGLDRYGSEDKALAAYLGAIDARGNITGAVDANGTGGNQYIRTVRERMQRYGDLISGSVNQTVVPPTPGNVGLARAREAPPATTAPADAPDWFKGYAAAGGQTSAAAAPAARGGQAPATTLSPEAAGKQAVAASWALQQLGSKAYYNLCQRFIEQAYGTGGGYTSAAAAGQALVTHADPSRADVGDLVFFRPDPSNGMAGHAAIYLGNGEMVGATYGGVTRDRIDSPYWSKLLLGFADPPAQWAGAKGASTPAVVQGASTLLGTAKATAGVAPPAAAQMGEDTPVWFRGYVAAGGR